MEGQTVREQKKQRRRLPGWVKTLLTVLITLVVSGGLWCALLGRGGLAMVETYLLARFAFVETDVDLGRAVDEGLSAFVSGLGDRWSYYLTVEGYQATTQRRANSYVGVGVTVDYTREEGLWCSRLRWTGPQSRRVSWLGM